MKGPRKAMGIAGVILLIQLFFLIPTITGTRLLPGDWTQYQPQFLLYIIMDLGALGLVYGFGKAERDVREGSLNDFIIRGFVWGFSTWVVLSLIFGGLFAGGTSLTASAKVPALVYLAFYVAPTEELLFREVLPSTPPPSLRNSKVLWPIFASGVMFAGFHVWAYGLSEPTLSGLVSALAFPFLLGIVFYGIYRYAPFGGYGAVTFIHFIYDAFVLGAITSLHFLPAWVVPL